MPVWNGFTGLNAAPTAAAPRLIATAVTASKPRRRVRRRRIGTKAMISSCIFSTMPPTAKATQATGMTSVSRRLPQRAGAVHHRERAAHQEDEEYDRARVGETFRNGHERLERTDRPRLHPLERSGDDDAPAGSGVDAALVAARREHPGQRRGEGDTRRQQCQRMGEVETARRAGRARGGYAARQERRIGGVFEQAIRSSIPLEMVPQAVSCARCMAALSVSAEAVASLRTPRNSIVTVQATFWLDSVPY